MALLPGLTWDVSISFKDKDNNLSGFGFYLPAALSADDAIAAATFIAQQADPLSNGVLVALSASKVLFDNVAFTSPAPVESDVERKGVFQFQTATRGVKTKVEIPSLDNQFVAAGSNVLKMDNALVLAFQAAMLNTGLGAANSPITVAGLDLVSAFGVPHKIHRGSSKG